MDEIINLIIGKLAARERNQLTIHYKDASSLRTSDFMHYQNIHIHSLPIAELRGMVEQETSPFLDWLADGLTYGINFHIYVPRCACTLLSLERLLEWPVCFYDCESQRMVSIPEKVITYRDIALLPPRAILVMHSRQLITDLAKEAMARNEITLFERFG